jgi:hypothetical protein
MMGLRSRIYSRDASKQTHRTNSLDINTKLLTTLSARQGTGWQTREGKA